MLFATSAFASRPLASGPRVPRAWRGAAVSGEYGYAAWTYSRQAKLNVWSWNGVGGMLNVQGWANLGSIVYARSEADDYIYSLKADTFLADTDTNDESSSAEATTQWLDFGKPGKMKALDAIDLDVLGIETVEVYVFIPNPDDPRDRTGTLAATISLVDAASGWTYNGEMIPTEDVGAATEFQLRLIGDANREVQINKITLHYTEITG
jgi:hypothetical protein